MAAATLDAAEAAHPGAVEVVRCLQERGLDIELQVRAGVDSNTTVLARPWPASGLNKRTSQAEPLPSAVDVALDLARAGRRHRAAMDQWTALDTVVVTDAADKFRGHFSDDVPGGDDASTLPAVEPLQIELRLALEPADRKFIDLLRMMSHRATVDDGDPLPPLPPEASWASSEKTLLQLSLTYDEWPGARRDDGKQLMRWRPASDRSLKVQVGSYSRAADTQKLMQHVHARAEGVRAALVSLGEAEARRLCHDPSTAKAIEGAIRDVLDAAAEAALNLQRDPARGVPLVLALLACATTLARPSLQQLPCPRGH